MFTLFFYNDIILMKVDDCMESRKYVTILGFVGFVLILTGVTYAFFNYTRTGASNALRVGDITFNSTESTLSLENAFPISREAALTNHDNVSSLSVNVNGSTSYNLGVEYLVSIDDSANSLMVNGQSIPVSMIVDTTQESGKSIGTNDDDYFSNRGGNNSIYKVLASDTIYNNEKVLVGFIAPNTEIDGKITISVYFDRDKIGISDTYYDGETPSEFGEGRVILTTSEWNSLNSNAISFKIKVEANEGTWVENSLESFSPMVTKVIAGNNNSVDNYLTVTTNNATLTTSDNKTAWSNTIEYNNTIERGSSRFTVKVDKDFIQNDDTYYDITIDYLDDGTSNILLQSSSTSNNVMNYAGYGYGSYVEDYPMWNDREFYIKNLSHSLTDTGSWKKITFNVTNEFFEKGIDNYIHLYFGKNVQSGNEPTTAKISQVTITKRMFKIDSLDQNNQNIIGNIYAGNNFGMGFSIKNINETGTLAKVSYEVLDVDKKVIAKKVFDNVDFQGNETKQFFLENITKKGVFELIIRVNYGNYEEIEKIKFSSIISDMSSIKNNFLGLTVHLNYGGWYDNNIINNSLNLVGKLGFGNIRQGINDRFVHNDLQSGDYTNTLGRYEDTFDQITNSSFTVLPIVWDTYTTISTDGNGVITDASLANLKNELIEYYQKYATKYKNKFVYYEMPGEWNNLSYMTPEKYAYLVVEVAKKIKEIDSDAKIVALSSFDDIWCDNSECSYYSKIEANHQNFRTDSWMARVFNTRWEDNNNIEHEFLYYVDYISLDFYPYDFTKSIMDNYYIERIDGVRKLIEYYNTSNRNIPLIFTETGYHTSSNGASEELQAISLVQTLVFALANRNNTEIANSNFVSYNFDRVYLYSLQNEAQNNRYGEANFGIVNYYRSNKLKPFTRDVEMSAKPAYVAINMFNYLLNNSSLVDTNERINSDYLYYKFEKNNQKIVVLWNNGIEKSINLSSADYNNKDITIYDMYGNIVNSYLNSSNNISVSISNQPIYIVVSNHS